MIGEKIRKIREFRGYSQEVVAENLGISQPAYSKIETSGTEITFTPFKSWQPYLRLKLMNLFLLMKNMLSLTLSMKILKAILM
jgi:transcriptional regulator with XRE-family HTH domain